MVIVQAVYARLEILVILQGTVVPIYLLNGVGLCLQINLCLTGCQRTHVHTDTHRVAGHVERDIGALHPSLVDMYLPAVLGGGGIFRNGVVQCNVQLGIFQPGSIHFNGFPMEVYTIALDE